MNNNSFAEWIEGEMRKRGWSVPEVSRRSKRGGHQGISPSMIYMVINGQANPGQQFCEGIARAFDVRVDAVMQRAGILPSIPTDDETLQRVMWLWQFIPDSSKETIVAMIQGIALLDAEMTEQM
jgi:transcriptional regulator with XRE-family HTH domain